MSAPSFPPGAGAAECDTGVNSAEEAKGCKDYHVLQAPKTSGPLHPAATFPWKMNSEDFGIYTECF